MLNQEALRAVLFDLDGTLMDTDDQAVEALARRLAKLRLADSQSKARRLIMASETPGNAMMTLLDMVGLDGALTPRDGSTATLAWFTDTREVSHHSRRGGDVGRA